MKKEKTVRTYQRRTKSGKMVTVHEHKASYDAAEEARKAAAKKAGAGSELASKKKAKEAGELPFTADEYKAWYHWDLENDPKNPTALKVKKVLIAKLSPRGYKKYFDEMTDSWSARGHLKAFKGVGDVMKDRQDLYISRKMAATHRAQAALADSLGAKDAAESFRKRSQEASARAKEIASRVKSRGKEVVKKEENAPKLTAKAREEAIRMSIGRGAGADAFKRLGYKKVDDGVYEHPSGHVVHRGKGYDSLNVYYAEKAKKEYKEQADYIKRIERITKGEKGLDYSSWINAEKKSLSDLKGYKGKTISDEAYHKAQNALIRKHHLRYEEDGMYSAKDGKVYRITVHPITGVATAYPIVGHTYGATKAQLKAAGLKNNDYDTIDWDKASEVVWGKSKKHQPLK